eukprot:RCo024813
MSSSVRELMRRVLRRPPKLPQMTPAAERLCGALFTSLPADASVLDLGCTDPTLYIHLATRFKKLTGLAQLDLSDPTDAQAWAGLKQELTTLGITPAAMPSLYSLPPYQSEFDCVVTEDVLSYSPQDPENILKGVYAALKPGGSFVGEMGGDGNLETFRMACYEVLHANGVEAAPLDPFFFPTKKELQGMLQAQGFVLQKLTELRQLTAVAASPRREDMAMVDFLHNGMAQRFLKPFTNNPEMQRTVVSEILRLCHASMFRNKRWSHVAVRLQFIAVRPVEGATAATPSRG